MGTLALIFLVTFLNVLTLSERDDLWSKIPFSFFLSLILEDAQWSRGDLGRPARSHKVSIKIRVISSKLHLIQDAFKSYDLTVVQE